MAYSALFTSGLSLASQPRIESYTHTRPPPLQINVHPGTPRTRTRKRRSSLTIATSPISNIKSPARAANDAVKTVLRSPREGTFLEALQNGTRPKMVRRKTVSNGKDVPSLPAPTSPLPTLPTLHLDLSVLYPASAPITPTDEAYPSSPITSESPFPSHPSHNTTGSLRANPSRKSSMLLPMGRGPLSPSLFAGNGNLRQKSDLDMGMLVEEKDVPPTAWFDDDEDMKENGGDL